MQNYSPSPFGERGVSPFAYWLGLTLKYFLKTSRKYFPSQKPVLSATSVTEYFPSFNSSVLCGILLLLLLHEEMEELLVYYT